MGLCPSTFVSELKIRGKKQFATVTAVSEAFEAEYAEAELTVARGIEAGRQPDVFDLSVSGKHKSLRQGE